MAVRSRVGDDLEEIFGMFKDLTVGRIKRKSTCNGYKSNSIRAKSSAISVTNKERSLHKPRIIDRKSVLRESKLKLPPNFASVARKQKFLGNESSELAKETYSLKDYSKVVAGFNLNQSCSMEFRNSSLPPKTDCTTPCIQTVCYDNESDELAEYFEQALYLPKPMSAMAEMMYG